MAYFGLDPDHYGGWSEEEKQEELKLAEIPPGRVLREQDCEE